jgi:hypothetical protein
MHEQVKIVGHLMYDDDFDHLVVDATIRRCTIGHKHISRRRLLKQNISVCVRYTLWAVNGGWMMGKGRRGWGWGGEGKGYAACSSNSVKL